MRLLYLWGMRIVVGPHRRFGLERPDHDLFEAHPTACNTYIDHLIHGRTIVKPGIERLDGKRVIFTDGSEEEVDFLVGPRLSRASYRPFTFSISRENRSSSSIPSTASSTISSSWACSSRRKGASGSSPIIRRV
jgi:hypothetical protein